MIYLLSVITSCLSVFFKVFQHKNVIGGHLKMMALNSYVMAMFDVATVTLIIKGGWWIALTSGTGAAIGAVAAYKLHEHIFSNRNVSAS